MDFDSIQCLLVTANVGSVFEDPSRLLVPWVKEFLGKVDSIKPQFFAVHMQEVGGKTYEKSMEYVQEFIQNLCEADELSEYSIIRVYLDEDYNSAEHFTALGNLYFCHKSLQSVKIWNFLTHDWELADGKNIHTGNIEAIATKEKSKFPQHFFPECKWSRKGFMRTRWELNSTVIDLVNIHLFHDASNLAACEEFPSVYCKTRRRALVHTLERFHIDNKNGIAPYFIFGDFNFRCDTEGVVKTLTEDLTTHRIQNLKSDTTKLHFRNPDGDNVLTVGKKEFNHNDHQTKFKEPWMQKFDRELEPLNEILVEYNVRFPPTYPYEEDPEMPNSYMSTRCPSWCDRILMNPAMRKVIMDTELCDDDKYSIIGENICMGDHKPVYLLVQLRTNQGTYRCCNCFQHASFSNKPLKTFEQVIETEMATDENNVNPLCLYSSRIFKDILTECQKLDKNIPLKSNVVKHKSGKEFKSSLNNDQEESKNNENLTAHQPLISINIINSDNINICMCSILSEANANRVELINTDDGGNTDNLLDGTICPECRNIIKKQPVERCTLVSKRMLLANNIIVNRIDSHYLTTYIDGRGDPYTPESAESRSPYPEFDTNGGSSQNDSDFVSDETRSNNNAKIALSDNVAKSHAPLIRTDSRGIVSPGQLKSRLEHLQRTSLNDSDCDKLQVVTNMKQNRCFSRWCCNIL